MAARTRTPAELLRQITKLDQDIAALEERILLKRHEREELLDETEQAVAALRTDGNGHAPKARRNRGPAPGTPNHIHRKFSEDQVREMRERYASGESQTELGQAFGVPQPVVHSIVHRKTYKDVL